MNIIRFPVAAQEKKNSQLKLRMQRPDVTHNVMHLGPWNFECTRCDAAIKFESQAMVFRKLEFYCSSCGHLHTVSNPAFFPSNPQKK